MLIAIVANYEFDAYGNQSQENEVYNPFGYRGEYTDLESGLIYLRARMYDAETGRFINEDPVRDGLNWYAYCANDPVNFVDPLGLERLVISGGRYSDPSAHGHEGDFKYNSIEPAIKQLREMKENNFDNENITWLIANQGWTDSDLKKFRNVANDIGVGLEFIKKKDYLIDYINYKYAGTDDTRVKDLITEVVVFAHGNPGLLMLGFDYLNSNSHLTISMDDLTTDRIRTFDAFDNPTSMFYSCNTGKDISSEWGSNFAQRWVSITGGTAWAYIGKTDYGPMNNNESLINKASRKMHGFSYYGSENYPAGAVGAWVNTFWR